MKPKVKRKRVQVTCWCDGYWFPHRSACKYCNDYKGVRDEQYWLDHPMHRRVNV